MEGHVAQAKYKFTLPEVKPVEDNYEEMIINFYPM